MRFNRKSQVLH